MEPGFHQGPCLHFMGGLCQVYHMILTTTWCFFGSEVIILLIEVDSFELMREISG